GSRAYTSRPYRSILALYPGKHPGTFAAAQGGGSEGEPAAYPSACARAAPTMTKARGSMAPSLQVALAQGAPRAGSGHAAWKRLPVPRPDSGRRGSIHLAGRGGKLRALRVLRHKH